MSPLGEWVSTRTSSTWPKMEQELQTSAFTSSTHLGDDSTVGLNMLERRTNLVGCSGSSAPLRPSILSMKERPTFLEAPSAPLEESAALHPSSVFWRYSICLSFALSSYMRRCCQDWWHAVTSCLCLSSMSSILPLRSMSSRCRIISTFSSFFSRMSILGSGSDMDTTTCFSTIFSTSTILSFPPPSPEAAALAAAARASSRALAAACCASFAWFCSSWICSCSMSSCCCSRAWLLFMSTLCRCFSSSISFCFSSSCCISRVISWFRWFSMSASLSMMACIAVQSFSATSRASSAFSSAAVSRSTCCICILHSAL
mmetsp:Transcript_39455/g.85877  ORF Transcript_39455/g.85877 Transcript_39455/m.85877 type:complete len:315 (-) Transcript_39455:1580-2524(-)